MHSKPKWLATLATGALLGAALVVGILGGSNSTGVIAQTGCPATPVPGTSTSTAFGVTITATPVCGQTNQAFHFAATLQNAGNDTSDVQFLWNFGDGAVMGGNPVDHTYATAGTYTVQLFAQGSNRSASASLTVTVLAALQTGISGPAQAGLNQPVMLSATGTSALPADTTYSWDFGDGTTGTGQSVSHVYNTTGTYTITLTVASQSAGRTGTATQKIVITNVAPTITVGITGPTQVNAGASATFTIAATGNVPSDVQYAVNFGDGTAAATASAASPSVTHTFASPGSYTVTVTASSASTPGLSGTAATTVTVAATGPGVSFPAGWNQVSGPAGMTFTQCNGPLYTYQAGDTAYEVVQNTTAVASGRGYWCYLSSPTTISLTGAGSSSATIPAPAGQWVEIGNPSSSVNVSVKGADSVVQFDPASNGYLPVSVITPGKGAWAISLAGGTITVSQ